MGRFFLWSGRELSEIHKGLGIDDYGFDCFTMNCEKALNAMGIEENMIDEVIPLCVYLA